LADHGPITTRHRPEWLVAYRPTGGPPTHVWFFTPKNVAVVGSMKVTFVIRSALGNENPRIMAALTTANIVVTAQMPSASTKTASAQKPLSLVR